MLPTQADPILTALHYLFSHVEDRTIAHCLDLDLVTSGATLEEAEEKLNALVLCQIGSCWVSGNFAQLRFKAPLEYWQELKNARHLETTGLEIEVPPVVLPITRKFAVSLPVMRAEMQKAA